MNVLIVEDIGFVRLLLNDIIGKQGHVVVGEADNGEDGYHLYKILKPDVVFLDIAMPGWDGFKTMREIKRLDTDAQIVFCSAFARKEDVLQAIRLGAADFIAKPFQEEQLAEKLKN